MSRDVSIDLDMRRRTPLLAHAASLLCLGLSPACQSVAPTEPSTGSTNFVSDPAPTYLTFGELLSSGPKLALSERARAHHGKRVKLVGYMANLESPADGSFYLTPIAVTCDEAGDGTAELPLTSILVTVTQALAKPVEHVDGLVEVIGTIEVGKVADSLGRTAWFRLILDPSTFSTASTS